MVVHEAHPSCQAAALYGPAVDRAAPIAHPEEDLEPSAVASAAFVLASHLSEKDFKLHVTIFE